MIKDSVRSKRSVLKKHGLPTRGKIRFVPKKGWGANQDLLMREGGYVDKFDNVWKKGPSRTKGEAYEWDVQLSSEGCRMLRWLSREGKHVNVSLEGRVTH